MTTTRITLHHNGTSHADRPTDSAVDGAAPPLIYFTPPDKPEFAALPSGYYSRTCQHYSGTTTVYDYRRVYCVSLDMRKSVQTRKTS